LRQIFPSQTVFLTARRGRYCAFLDLEKAFDCVPPEGPATARRDEKEERSSPGAECWPATKGTESRLNVLEMLRWTAGVIRVDRIRDDVIRQKFGSRR
uniref:Reverse transcriptase domain-containing protein n=1 Tax=Heligmosomoides polygyrus TaxID=6339 RepID=A0A183G8E8_HELPZ